MIETNIVFRTIPNFTLSYIPSLFLTGIDTTYSSIIQWNVLTIISIYVADITKLLAQSIIKI